MISKISPRSKILFSVVLKMVTRLQIELLALDCLELTLHTHTNSVLASCRIRSTKLHLSVFHHFMGNRWGNSGWLYFFVLQNHCRWWLQPWHLLLGRKVMTNLDSILKSRDITLSTKVRLVKVMVFSVVTYGMWELDCEESWVPKNWCFWTVLLEKTLESPLNCKEIQPVLP